MPEINGNWVTGSNGYNLYRVLIRTSGTTIIVYDELAAGVSTSGSLIVTRTGDVWGWPGSASIGFGTPGTVRELYRQDVGKVNAAFTVSLASGNGTSTATLWVDFTGSSTPLPGKPSNVQAVRTGSTTAKFTWAKGTNASFTRILANVNNGATYTLAEPTGTTQNVTGLTADSVFQFLLLSVNDTGASGTVGAYPIFTTPKTPTTPVLASGKKVSWTLPSRWKHGVQLQRTDNGGTTVTTYDLGLVTEWTDPVAQSPLSQYRVRVWAGPSLDEAKTYSGWSSWSDTVMGLTYKLPAVTKLDAYRCNSAGERSETGTYLRVVSSGTVSKVPNAAGVETNKVTRKVAYRKVGTTTWTETSIVTNAAPNDWTNAGATLGGGGISETSAWEVRYTVQDTYSTVVPQALIVPVAKVPFSIGKDGTGHGKAHERGALDVAGPIYADTLTGILVPFAGASSPAGWLLCDGQAVSRTAFVGLFAVIGTTYGVGDGSTTFNVPDLRGRAVFGLSTGTEFNTLGKTGGATTHTLTTAQMPSHTHGALSGGNFLKDGTGSAAVVNTSGSGYARAATTAETGSGAAHNNMPPYLTANWLIKA